MTAVASRTVASLPSMFSFAYHVDQQLPEPVHGPLHDGDLRAQLLPALGGVPDGAHLVDLLADDVLPCRRTAC